VVFSGNNVGKGGNGAPEFFGGVVGGVAGCEQ
jgi:hypothetical protein